MPTVYDRPKTNVAKRRPRKPGLGNITGRRKPPLQRPVRPGDGPGGRERQKPVGPGRPINPGGRERIGRTDPTRPTRPGKGGKVGTWKPLKPGGLTKGKPGGRGKVAKPRRLKKQVMY